MRHAVVPAGALLSRCTQCDLDALCDAGIIQHWEQAGYQFSRLYYWRAYQPPPTVFIAYSCSDTSDNFGKLRAMLASHGCILKEIALERLATTEWELCIHSDKVVALIGPKFVESCRLDLKNNAGTDPTENDLRVGNLVTSQPGIWVRIEVEMLKYRDKPTYCFFFRWRNARRNLQHSASRQSQCQRLVQRNRCHRRDSWIISPRCAAVAG